MDYYKIISSKINFDYVFSLDEISLFYKNTFLYNEYLKLPSLSEKERIQKYIQYMIQSARILKYIKKRLDLITDLDNYLKNKKILSSHLKAIIDSKKINLSNKEEVSEFCFYYGWIFPETTNEKDLFVRGKIIINKLKSFEISNFVEDLDEITQLSKYYEWRKLIWMRLSYLIKNINQELIIKELSEFDFDEFERN